MTQDEKELLLKDLCARLPYGVKVGNKATGLVCTIKSIEFGDGGDLHTVIEFEEDGQLHTTNICVFYGGLKPYLRPMSSMTEGECVERINLFGKYCPFDNSPEYFDWLNKHHLDYRGLIEKQLALEAPKGMYNN